MPEHTSRTCVVGGGAAGHAAATALAGGNLPEEVLTHFLGAEDEAIDRTLVDKALLRGRATVERIRLAPVAGIRHSYTRISSITSHPDGPYTLHLADGSRHMAEHVVIATGSRARQPPLIPGLDGWSAQAKAASLHSSADALRLAQTLARFPHGARILIHGTGILGAEVASILHEMGHVPIMVARSHRPLEAAFGPRLAAVARQILEDKHDCYWGEELVGLGAGAARLRGSASQSREVPVDIVLNTLGTEPNLPRLSGMPGISDVSAQSFLLPVDAHMRVLGAGGRLYAAGSVATLAHLDERIDHFDDAAAQGHNAALNLLADHCGTDSPAPYVPRSPFTVRLHRRTLIGFGYRRSADQESVHSEDPLVVASVGKDERTNAVLGFDSARQVRGLAAELLNR